MYVDLASLTERERYGAMTDAIVPRPIAWVLTDNGADAPQRWNLAPFSFFAGASSEPPQVVFSVGHILGTEGRKDTYSNLLLRPECVVHIPSLSHAQAVESSSARLERGVSELERAGLSTVEFEGWPVPRVDGLRVALACRAHRFIPIAEDERHVLILATVQAIYVDDEVSKVDYKGRRVVDVEKLEPLGRAGRGSYLRVGDAFRVSDLTRSS